MTYGVPELVYALCALTSLLCALLVARAWRRSRQRMLLLIALCFAGLAINNLLLVVDLLFIPGVDFAVARGSVGLVSMAGLLFVLIWEAR